MMKKTEASQRSWLQFALYGVLASLIAAFCLMGTAQVAHAAGNDLANTNATTDLVDAGVDNLGGNEQDVANTAGQESSSDPGNVTDPDAAQSSSANTPPANEDQPSAEEGGQGTTTPEQQKPESQPTQAGWMQDTDGTWYYFDDMNAAPRTGWIKSGGKWYWLQPEKNGAMAANQWIEDQGNRYYVNGNGVMATKWIHIGNDWYYANKSGAQVMNGWIKSGGKWYWLQGNKQGLMAANQWIEDQGSRYYLGNSGAMAKGWAQVGNDWYYTNKSGAQVMNGWIKSGGKWYWLQGNKQGLMAANQWIEDRGSRYYLGNSGAMAKGWAQVGNDWYYTNKSGAQVMNGWIKSGGKWYWLQGDQQGLMLANAMKVIDGAQYSFDGNGAMRKNCQIDLGDGVVGYAASSGAISRIGEYKDGKLVLTNSEGQILTGWQSMAGKWFYGEASTGVAQTGWLKLGSTWYYLDSHGAMVTGTRTIDGKTNIFSGSGKWLGTDAMVTKAQGYSSNTGWLILVDRGRHTVGVFNGSQGNWNLEKKWACVTGAPGSPTITGVFKTTGGKRMNLSTDSRARWCTQINGGYFFHTILASDAELGSSASHGCIRLSVPNAQWIYHNIGAGTTVVIYN